jgi:integrase
MFYLETPKTNQRVRIVPMPAVVVEALQAIKDASPWTDPADLVFPGAKRGKPIDIHNLERRTLKPAAVRLGMPWLSWHCLRRTFASTADLLQFPIADVVSALGHGGYGMSLRYSQPQIERRRAGIDQMAALLSGKQAEGQAEGQTKKRRSGRRSSTKPAPEALQLKQAG